MSVKAVWLYLVPAEGFCEQCMGDAQGVLVALDEQGAGRISPPLCEMCLWSRLVNAEHS